MVTEAIVRLATSEKSCRAICGCSATTLGLRGLSDSSVGLSGMAGGVSGEEGMMDAAVSARRFVRLIPQTNPVISMSPNKTACFTLWSPRY